MGPNPAQAVADKHGSGAYSKKDDRKSGASSRSTGQNSGGLGWVTGVLEVGADGGDSQDLAVTQSIAPDSAVALRSAAVEEPTGVNASGAAPRGGSGYSTATAGTLRSPRVVFGNGRTPGMHVPASEFGSEREILRDYSLEASAAPDSVPAVPEAVEIDIPPLPPPLPPVEHMRPARGLVGDIGTGTIDTTTDPLAGLAGLILIPAIGAAVGFRQARAAQSLESAHTESART